MALPSRRGLIQGFGVVRRTPQRNKPLDYSWAATNAQSCLACYGSSRFEVFGGAAHDCEQFVDGMLGDKRLVAAQLHCCVLW